MTIEEKIFAHKRFDENAMTAFGFQKTDGGRVISLDLPGGDFTAVLTVANDGRVRGRVVDRMSGEDYLPLRVESFGGAFVQAVRSAYEELLSRICRECCRDVLFMSDQANRIALRIEKRYGVSPDFPFDNGEDRSAGVFRHTGSQKWFGLIMNVKKKALLKNGDEGLWDVLNLKAKTGSIDGLLTVPGIYPAYHMNKKYWISLTLDERLSDEEVMERVAESYVLTDKK